MSTSDGDEAGTRGAFSRFVHSEVAGSVVLLVCTAAALVWANCRWSATYFSLAGMELGLTLGASRFALTVQYWVNDLLMAVFFFVVGLEIKRELVAGQLSSLRRAALPVMAALGGMIVPAIAYARLNAGGSGGAGWGVPMATDIAFSLGVLSLLGRRVPLGLKVFLTALAIADDLGAVLVIAIFYAGKIRVDALLLAGLLLVILGMLSNLGARRPLVYLVLGVGVWAAVLASGVHATVAGILVAMLVPVRLPRDPGAALAVVSQRYTALRESALTPESMIGNRSQLDAIVDLHAAASDLRPPGLTLEQALHPLVAFVILPLFAFFNAGVRMESGIVATLHSPVALGVFLGLVFGKQAGILLFAWAAVRSGHAELPEGVGWSGIYGSACLAGIGFTMSLFVAELAFPGGALLAQAKLGILAASLVSAAWGGLWLYFRQGDRAVSG